MCWIWKELQHFDSNMCDLNHLIQWGFCWGKAVGARIHGMAGSAMLLLDIHVSRIFDFNDWRTAKDLYDRYPASIRVSLRSRGSTHRSYWRAGGRRCEFSVTTTCVLQVATCQCFLFRFMSSSNLAATAAGNLAYPSVELGNRLCRRMCYLCLGCSNTRTGACCIYVHDCLGWTFVIVNLDLSLASI